MKKLFPFGILLAFQFIYMEWGNHRQFVFQMQYDAMANIMKNLSSLSNPLVFVFFLAEFLLLFTLFQKHPNRKLILTGTLLLLPYALLALFGGLAGRPKIIVSTLPFLAMSIAFFFKFRSFNPQSESHGAK